MKSLQQQQQLQQIYNTRKSLELRLKQMNDKGVNLRMEVARMKEMDNLLRREDYQSRFQEIEDLYQQFSTVRQRLIKASADKKVDVSDIEVLKLSNQSLRNSLQTIKCQIEQEQLKQQFAEKEYASKEALVEKLVEMKEEQAKQRSNNEDIQPEPNMLQENLFRELAQIHQASINSNDSLYLHLFKACDSVAKLEKELQEKEINLLENQIYLNQLQKSHQQLQNKYRRVNEPEQEMSVEKSETDLKEQLDKLETEYSQLVSEQKEEITQEAQIYENIQSLATTEAMKKIRHFLAPKIEDIARKRRAVERVLQIIQSSVEQNHEDLKTMTEEFQQLRKLEDYLNSKINSLSIPEPLVQMRNY